jgi:hypothetical protein
MVIDPDENALSTIRYSETLSSSSEEITMVHQDDQRMRGKVLVFNELTKIMSLVTFSYELKLYLKL